MKKSTFTNSTIQVFYKESNYILHFPEDNNRENLVSVFGKKTTDILYDMVRELPYLYRIDGTYVDCIPLNPYTIVFVMKSKNDNVYILVEKDDTMYTLVCGHNEGNEISSNRLYKSFRSFYSMMKKKGVRDLNDLYKVSDTLESVLYNN